MSFNIYRDIEEQFLYIEKNGNWYMTLYEFPDVDEIHIVPIPKIRDTSELVKEDPKFWDCFEDDEITKCSKCDGDGYYFEVGDDDYVVCDCYYGQRHGREWLEKFLEEEEEEFFNHDDYLEWRRR